MPPPAAFGLPPRIGAFLSSFVLIAALGATVCSGMTAPAGDEQWAAARSRMVNEQIAARDISDAPTLRAMGAVPRHLFVRPGDQSSAYDDHPLPIGHGQTISQPYVVAFMTAAMGLKGGEKVLEIGTGSGYQAAVLARIAAKVFTIEIVEPLAEGAKRRLAALGYDNVGVRAGDGYAGWPEEAPFDAIMVTAAAPQVPEPLKQQLRDGGRLVIPVGSDVQEIVVVTRHGDRFREKRVLPVRFVPMTGEIRK